MSYNSGLTDAQIRATALPVSGTVTVTPSGTQTVSGSVSITGSVAVTGPLTDTQIRATALPVSLASTTITGTVTTTVSGSVAVTGTFWQATQPVSGTVTVGNASLAVTGTFFQATQPISAASLPLPAGASSETTLAALNAKVTAVNTGAVTISGALPTGANVIGTVNRPANTTAGGTLTANDAVVAAPVGDGTLITGASTAGSIVAIPVPDGFVAWTLLIKSYTSGTIYTEASNNSTNGTDGDWVEVKGRRTGTAPGTESVVYAMVANGYYRGNGAGFKYLRARLIGGGTGAVIRWDVSSAMGATFLNSGIPGGSSSIGTVILGAGSAAVGSITVTGTTAVSGTFFQATQPVSIAASVAVTGTFWQATQPVSLASTTITGSVAVTGPLTDTQIRATALPVSLTSTTITGTVAVSAASLPLPTGAATETTLAALNTKVTAVNTGAVTISAALPAGTNALGSVSSVDSTASGTITAISQAVALALNGKSGATIQITGTWVGTLQFEGTVDGTNWTAINGVFAGTSTPGSTITANGIVRLTPSGLAQFRITSTAWTSGTATISLRASDATGGTFLNQSLTAGTNIIGKVGIDQTTPGTTNLVSIGTSGTVALNAAIPTGANVIGAVTQSGTWNVGSITTLPALSAGAAVIGAVTQSGTWNVGSITTLPALVAGSAIVGKVGIDQTTPGTTNLVSIGTNGTVAINAALPTGANVIGALTANQSVNNAQIGGIAPLMGNGVTGTGSQRVTIASDNTAFTVNTTPTTPTASIITSAATTNATSVKASAGTLYSITVSNAGAAAAFVKLYNLAVAPTVGTSVIALTIPIAASGVVTIPFGAQGMRFGTGIALAITNLVGETDATAVAANQVKVLTSYI